MRRDERIRNGYEKEQEKDMKGRDRRLCHDSADVAW